MFITQPAIKTLALRYVVLERGPRGTRNASLIKVLNVETGITAGDVHLALRELCSPQNCTEGYECITQKFEIVLKRDWCILENNVQIEALSGTLKYRAAASSTLTLNSQSSTQSRWEHQDSTQKQWEYLGRTGRRLYNSRMH